ncbi:MAG TPA: hypothetical protein VGX71_24895 [Pseudaminobacter sp.]|nr:hypothetical protein [Pseudaminobacter sp.]
MYEPFEARIKEWLKEDPALSAAAVLQRLKDIDPARFEEKNIRMVQRLVKVWRMEMAGLVILDGGWITSLPVPPAAAMAGEMSTVATAALGNIDQWGNRRGQFLVSLDTLAGHVFADGGEAGLDASAGPCVQPRQGNRRIGG